MKKILAALLFLILFMASSEVFASKIPQEELNVLRQSFPKLNVRFDGVVELPDGTSYIPVYPIQTKKTSMMATVTQTIPANKSLKDKPDFVMFNTNFALFKIKQEKDKKTIIYNDAIPYEVKMGLLPQDLLVPTGFQIPDELRIIIGDLIIPITEKEGYKEIPVAHTVQGGSSVPTTKLVTKTAEQLYNKYFYATSFNSNALTVLNADTGKAFKQIDFDSIPSDIKLTNNGRYLLVSTIASGSVYVVDTVKTAVLKEIATGIKPFQIAVSESENLAYIANRGDNKISVINILTMQPEQDIEVSGNPCYISLSEDGQKMYYLDAISGVVYYLEKQDNYFKPYTARQLFRANNISKIQLVGDKIYTLDRGKNQLEIFYMNGKPQKEGIVNVSDITPIAAASDNVEPVDYNYYNEKKGEFVAKKEKKTFKQKTRTAFRKLLYYPEDDVEELKQPENPDNQVFVYAKKEAPKVVNVVENEPTITTEDNTKTKKGIFKRFKKEKNNEPKVKKTAKEMWFDFLNYKAPVKANTEIQEIKLNTEKQMDFITAQGKANDFIVIKNKIYLLCSDDNTVYVYDAMTNAQINSFELDNQGYYNSLKVSNDKKVGIITNISSNTLTLFDTESDAVIQKLPISVNVHNVVITGKN